MRHFLLTLLCAYAVSATGQASSRVMYFGQSGINIAKSGFGKEERSSCVIAISNPSAVSQRVLLVPQMVAGGDFSGSAACTVEAGPSPLNPPGAVLPAGSSPLIVRCTYPDIPRKKTGEQTVNCGGRIEVWNQTTSPGTVEASGSLEVFVETGRTFESRNPAGVVTDSGVGAYAVYSIVPVSVNDGKPF